MDDARATDLVEELNDLGQLAAGVGHHVINAFSAIVSHAELIRLGVETPGSMDQTALADTIIRTAVDASGVARRLIDYTRAATATGEADVALDRLARVKIESFRQRKDPRISWSFLADPVPLIRGNVAQLNHMLDHLLRNSLEAMPLAGGSIQVKVGLDDRGWVLLEISDTGLGMPPGVQERAVEPFFSTKNGRAGIGLSVANGIWRRHRGTLALQSRQGDGTCVRLCVQPIPSVAKNSISARS